MDNDSTLAARIEEVRSWVRDAERIVVLTGAGISTDSGIPDFRGPQGVWTKDPAAMRSSNIADYVADPEVRKLFEQSNPWALRSIAERLLEANDRGLWDASGEAVGALRAALLEGEGWEETRS